MALLLAAVGVALTWEAWAEIYAIASRDNEYTHIFLVPLLSLWLIWVRRMRIGRLRVTGNLLGPILVLVGWALSYWGFNYSRTAAFHAGAVVTVVGCVVSALGRQVVFRFMPAVAVLLFLVPMPDQWRQLIAQPLQQWTASIAHVLLDLMHVDTTLYANTLAINGERVNFLEACNGMRLVFPLLLIAYAFAFALPLRGWVRVVVILSSPIIALTCNVLRTLPTIWLYGRAGDLHGADYKSAHDLAEHFHDYSGWLMLPLSFVLLLGLIALLRWMMVPVERYTLASHG